MFLKIKIYHNFIWNTLCQRTKEKKTSLMYLATFTLYLL